VEKQTKGQVLNKSESQETDDRRFGDREVER
jgi:hypothetical protein